MANMHSIILNERQRSRIGICYAKATRSAPPTINTTPSDVFHVSASPRKIADMMTTNTTQTTGSQSAVSTASGQTAIRTYLAGEDAMLAIKLDRPDRTDIDDGDYKNMKLWRGEYKMGNLADPAGVVGAGTSYNAIFAVGVPPDTFSRARCFDAVPQTT